MKSITLCELEHIYTDRIAIDKCIGGVKPSLKFGERLLTQYPEVPAVLNIFFIDYSCMKSLRSEKATSLFYAKVPVNALLCSIEAYLVCFCCNETQTTVIPHAASPTDIAPGVR